jgi:uncharacterized protein (TIGR03085 family)
VRPLRRARPSVPTLIEGWTANDLAAHIMLRKRDLVAGPCIALPGPFARFAERRRADLAKSKDFAWLVSRIRAGPPIGFFRIGWVPSLPNLNEFFVHREDLRRANGMGSRTLTPALDAALWRNVRHSSRHLSRRLRDVGLDVEWPAAGDQLSVRSGEPRARLSGPPGELVRCTAPPLDQVIAHTNLYWSFQTAPGRTAATVETEDVDFAG